MRSLTLLRADAWPAAMTAAAGTAAVAALWLVLYRPVLAYLSIVYGREDFRTNQLALAGVAMLIASRVRRPGVRARLRAGPRLDGPAAGLALAASLGYLACERFLAVNTLAATCFGLATYGLVGLWMAPAAWRRGLPAALLLVGTLPFGEHLQTFVGYPLRVATAAAVRDGLALAGVPSVGADTILVFENGVSQVDLPCSGVKSLWTGLLFLVASTWVERRRLGRAWLAVAAVLAGLLVAANAARVAALVAVGVVAGWERLAAMLHVPLGVLGFAGACAMAVALVRRWVPADDGGEGGPAGAGAGGADVRTAAARLLALGAVVAGLAALHQPRPPTAAALAAAAPGWRFPAALMVSPLPLAEAERAWLIDDGAEAVERYRFRWHGLSGSVILVASATWRAHHRPERCFEVYGLRLDESRTALMAPGLPVRWVRLGDPGGRAGGSERSATYWFQSAARTTDDYATRIWADVARTRERWVLVSVVLDAPAAPEDPAVRSLVAALHAAVAEQLTGGST